MTTQAHTIKISQKTTVEELGALVCQTLNSSGIDAFLSGGAVVSIYTHNQYESYDLDFVSFGDRKKIKKVMEGLGFSQEVSRHFIHPETKFIVEFPGTSMEIGHEPIHEFSERVVMGHVLKLLTPTDCIKDRLAAFIHWNDKQGLEQAVMVAKSHPAFQIEKIKAFCMSEGSKSAFDRFVEKIKSE